MLHPRVMVLRGGQLLAEHPMPPGTEVVIGRSEGCDVSIPDGSVSRLHARLVADEQGVYVEDLGSANGTFVDGERARGRVRLAHGQQVRAAQRALSAPLVVRFEDVRPATLAEPAGFAELAAEWGDGTAGGDADRETLAPFVPEAPFVLEAAPEPLWRAGAPAPPPAPAPTAPVAANESPAAPSPRASAAGAAGARTWPWVLAGVVLIGGLAAAALAGWWLFASRRAEEPARSESRAADSVPPAAATAARTAAAVPQQQLFPAAPAPSVGEDVLVVPVESDTGAAAPGTTTAPSSTTARVDPLSGKWTARLENVFYPEDDYAVELRLDLHQRGGEVSGKGQVFLEGNAMTFGVPATTASGTVRASPAPRIATTTEKSGAPPRAVRLRLAFGRPIGELQLEGTLDGDALAGTFRSSLVKQSGAWQAVRAPQ